MGVFRVVKTTESENSPLFGVFHDCGGERAFSRPYITAVDARTVTRQTRAFFSLIFDRALTRFFIGKILF